MAIEHGERKANAVRRIVEAKENFVWATCMEGLCDIFGIEHLGVQISKEVTGYLESAGLVCYPSPLPRQQQKSAIIVLKESRFAKGFDPLAQDE